MIFLALAAYMQLGPGICAANFERIVRHIKSLQYEGPLAIGSNRTKCVQDHCVHNNFIVGGAFDVDFEQFENPNSKSKDLIANNQLSSKVSVTAIVWLAE